MSSSPSRWFSTLLWGNSVTLSWTWGLGLFFSVQFSIQFGFFGLLSFAIPNAIGLLTFGLVTHHIARREKGGESLARFFSGWSRPFRLVFYLYQILAISLTIFAFLFYGWQSLGFEPWLLYLPLTLLVVLAAAILLGEEFGIKLIKYSHGVFAVLILVAIGCLLFTKAQMGVGTTEFVPQPTNDMNYWGYAVPIIVGFLLGPWLDLQQWQRAIQMHRERVSIAAAYWIGAIEFFGILVFHGTLALWAMSHGAGQFLRKGLSGYEYGHDVIMKFFFADASGVLQIAFIAYCVFICACIITTLDSGYVALKWFLKENVAKSNSPIFALIPTGLFTSPIPTFLLAGVVAFVATILTKIELEYFMIFYATFFVGYSALGVTRCYMNRAAGMLPQIKMFCIGTGSVVIFAFGYFLHQPIAMIAGALWPLVSTAWLIFKPSGGEEFVSGGEELSATSVSPLTRTAGVVAASVDMPESGISAIAGAVAQAAKSPLSAVSNALGALHNVSGHFEGKWFVHSFVATYADTNSVGNVYFGMYAMWVGKTRELFFNRVMPKFNLANTPFYILTRSFEHKFAHETREFETVSVKIRIAKYNRKFVTLEHEIYDSAGTLLGHGSQSLLFVTSTDYKMIDTPPEVVAAFTPYA